MTTPSAGESTFGARRICYMNFASHLLNAYDPNMLYPGLPNAWSDADWFRFIDMIAAFGYNAFEFWLEPRLFAPDALRAGYGSAFARQMNAVIDHAHAKGLAVELLAGLVTVGSDWHTHCPHIPAEWAEVKHLWAEWCWRLPGVDIYGIFPGDPGGCSRNGCTHETYIDGSCEVALLLHGLNPRAEVELGTWGPPIFAWGVIEGPADWQGEFLTDIQQTAWHFDKRRAAAAMQHLLERLPQFPPNTSVAINLGFNPDSNPLGDQDARPWAREIAKTHRILTWDYSLTEGENSIYPHYRFDRLFRRRQEEAAAAPYYGGICYTMTPLLSQLSLYEAARSFQNPGGDHRTVAEEFCALVFGAAGKALARYLPLFEIIPDWGQYATVRYDRAAYHATMCELVDLLESLAGHEADLPAFHPAPPAFREELLFFARLFADLSDRSPDFDALHARYWQRVYAIYDQLPAHVDPRPHMATDRLVGFFAAHR